MAFMAFAVTLGAHGVDPRTMRKVVPKPAPRLNCVNCGAPLTQADGRCSYCTTPATFSGLGGQAQNEDETANIRTGLPASYGLKTVSDDPKDAE